ncbi:MAG: hypothetical protein IPG50_23700 [Myxococcales bacterium]|nr:hypothetical protein [Myxococcales bacterium]
MIRALSSVSLCVLVGTFAACAPEGRSESLGSSEAALADVTQTAVKRQSIGNCWLYATASWAESLHKSATGTELNSSESYWSYWHWFDQITEGWSTKIETGGSFDVAAGLIDTYGVMAEGDFIEEESDVEMSARQHAALDAINLSLSTGVLKTEDARRDRALVRAELDRAWSLSTAVVAQLDDAFGADVSRTLKRDARIGGTSIKAASALATRLLDPETKAPVDKTLADALGESSGNSWWSRREGPLAWKKVNYPTGDSRRRDLLGRVQRALHDKQPVILSFFVDFNALDGQGRFFAPPATPGRQGGHMVVMDDYEISNVPGFGTLRAGVVEERPEALSAALASEATIDFIRVKNSWGANRPDRQFVVPGYHDLYMNYLNGPIKQCSQTPEGNTDTSNCWDDTPLNDVVLPAGY